MPLRSWPVTQTTETHASVSSDGTVWQDYETKDANGNTTSRGVSVMRGDGTGISKTVNTNPDGSTEEHTVTVNNDGSVTTRDEKNDKDGNETSSTEKTDPPPSNHEGTDPGTDPEPNHGDEPDHPDNGGSGEYPSDDGTDEGPRPFSPSGPDERLSQYLQGASAYYSGDPYRVLGFGSRDHGDPPFDSIASSISADADGDIGSDGRSSVGEGLGLGQDSGLDLARLFPHDRLETDPRVHIERLGMVSGVTKGTAGFRAAQRAAIVIGSLTN